MAVVCMTAAKEPGRYSRTSYSEQMLCGAMVGLWGGPLATLHRQDELLYRHSTAHLQPGLQPDNFDAYIVPDTRRRVEALGCNALPGTKLGAPAPSWAPDTP